MLSDPEVAAASAPPAADAPFAAARRRPRWLLRFSDLALVVLGGLAFLVLCYLPLQPAALWGDLTFGDWIRQHRALPTADPVLPLAEGMPVFDGAWLSQTLLATVAGAAGTGGLSMLYALTVAATLLLLARTFYRQTGSKLWSAGGVILALALAWGPTTVFTPQTFGALCFATLLWLTAGVSPGEEGAVDERAADEGTADEGAAAPARPGWRRGLGVAVLFVLWANLHPSFVYGLAVLACGLLGRLLEVAWPSRSLRALAADRPLRRWLLLGELAVAATLVNPYGIDLLLQALWLPASDNLRDLPGWQPLAIAGAEGWAFAASVVLLLIAFRHSRRRVPASHVLLLAFFGGAAVLRTGRLAWYGPVLALVVVPHLADMAAARARRFAASPAGPFRRAAAAARRRLGALAGPSWLYSALTLLLVWMIFSLTPLGAAVLRGSARAPAPRFPAGTPVALTEYLRANPPRGQTFLPLGWADWLTREGPPGLQPFVISHVERLPGRVWRDYLRIVGGEASWQRILDRYRIETVIFERVAHREQARALRNSGDWKVAYEDDLAEVFVRASAAPAAAGAPAAGAPAAGAPAAGASPGGSEHAAPAGGRLP